MCVCVSFPFCTWFAQGGLLTPPFILLAKVPPNQAAHPPTIVCTYLRSRVGSAAECKRRASYKVSSQVGIVATGKDIDCMFV